jgi:hypothetical protein
MNKATGETEWETSFHVCRARKILMVERRDLVDRTVRMIRGAQAIFLWAEVSYVTMFPRHVEPCCDKHITQEDVWVMTVSEWMWTETLWICWETGMTESA